MTQQTDFLATADNALALDDCKQAIAFASIAQVEVLQKIAATLSLIQDTLKNIHEKGIAVPPPKDNIRLPDDMLSSSEGSVRSPTVRPSVFDKQ